MYVFKFLMDILSMISLNTFRCSTTRKMAPINFFIEENIDNVKKYKTCLRRKHGLALFKNCSSHIVFSCHLMGIIIVHSICDNNEV